MFRNAFNLISHRPTKMVTMIQSAVQRAAFSAVSAVSGGVPLEEMPFFHFGKRPRFRKEKFESPRKRANKMMHLIQREAIEKSKAAKPAVWDTPFRVGDAVEIQLSIYGGVESQRSAKIRGVVLGRFNKGLDTSILIRDVLAGLPVERRIPLHSPMVRSLKVLEQNFVFRGKRKVKRAKLYYLRDRNPLLCRVTKPKK